MCPQNALCASLKWLTQGSFFFFFFFLNKEMHALVVVSNAIRIISHSLSCLLAYTYHNKLTIPLPNRIVQKKKRLHQPFFLLYTLFEDSDSNVYLLSMCLPLLPTYLKPLHLLVSFLVLFYLDYTTIF